MEEPTRQAGDGREETELERDDRNLIMLTAPTSWHRILFRQGDKEHLVAVANRFILAGLTAMGFTTVGVVMLISDVAFSPAVTAIVTAAAVVGCATVWCVLPLARRRALSRTGDRPLTRRPDAA